MTKKTLTVYGMLFLFAFTFAFAFTMESQAEPEACYCCMTYCDTDPEQIEVLGHIDRRTGLCTGLENTCYNCVHWTFQCPPTP